MAIKKPDEIEHNNPNYAVVDSEFVRGGKKVVATLAALYALVQKTDQLKENYTEVFVLSELKSYRLKNISNVGNSSGWEEITYGGGGIQKITITERSELDAIKGENAYIINGGSNEFLISLIKQLPLPVFPSYQVYSDYIDVLDNNGVNTGSTRPNHLKVTLTNGIQVDAVLNLSSPSITIDEYQKLSSADYTTRISNIISNLQTYIDTQYPLYTVQLSSDSPEIGVSYIQISVQKTKIESRSFESNAWTAWTSIGGGGGVEIDDNTISALKTWSAYKIAEELSGKEAAGTSELAITQLIDGATDNTLKKLQDKITAINAIIGGSTADGDSIVNTVAELLAVFSSFPEGSDMVTLLTAKLNTSDVYNALDRILEGKPLDARQGKVLKDLIDQLRLDLNNINPAKELLISKSTFNSIAEPGIYLNNATAKQIIGHRLTSNATDFSITISGVTYDKTATYPIVLPANQELTINDVIIQTGYNVGNVILIIQ